MAGSLKAYSGLADVRDLVKLCYEVRNRLAAAADAFAASYGLATWDAAGVAAAFPGLPVALVDLLCTVLGAVNLLRARADAVAAAMPSNDLPPGA